ncbi:MAG: glycosyltransferase family 4 protein [Planctomycetes bacterium]|nr:glycosyltransferase family 4 protein [Planctomycetota bacterium]
MKIAIIVPTFFKESSVIGGAERYALELSRALSVQEDVELITFGKKNQTENKGRLTIRTIKTWWWVRSNNSNPFSLSFLSHLRDKDIIHSMQFNTIVANLAWFFRKASQPFLLTDLAGGGFNVNKWCNLVRRADCVPSISLFSAQYMQRNYGVPEYKTPLVYAGVDTHLFSPTPVARENIIVYVGRLVHHKGIDVLIQALPDNAHLKLIGRPYDKAYQDHLISLAQGKQVEFIQDADDETIVRAFRTAKAAVLPSVPISERPELFGLVTAEAMACECPVVVSDAGSLPEVVDHGKCGFVVPAGEISPLHDKLQALLNDDALVKSMGKSGRQRVLDLFTWEHVAERHLDIYQHLLQER